jgi:hypothetical protein
VDKASAKELIPKVRAELFVPSSQPEPKETTEERERRKAEAEKKRKELEERRKTDAGMRAAAWLAGIGKDIQKAKMLQDDASKTKLNGSLESEYVRRFGDHVNSLTKLREELENALSTKSTKCESVKDAEEVVQAMRKDAKAWAKLKDVYEDNKVVKSKP